MTMLLTGGCAPGSASEVDDGGIDDVVTSGEMPGGSDDGEGWDDDTGLATQGAEGTGDDDGDNGGGTGGGESTCEDVPPQPPLGFPGTLCTCDDLTFPGAFQAVAALDGTPARVGVNGITHFDGAAQIEGDAIFHSGLEANAAFEVQGDSATVGHVALAGAAHVGGDLDIGGDLTGYGFLDVDGKLGVAGDQSLLGLGLVGSYGPYVAPARPCACDPQDLIDIVGKVEQARQVNDNGAIGLPLDLQGIGLAHVELPTGSYYVENLEVIGLLSLEVTGHVELHVGDSIRFIGADFLQIDPGGSLALYVAGSVETMGHVVTGNPDDAGAFTLYVGGTGSTLLDIGNQVFHGSIYAPTTEFEMLGNTHVRGSMFVKSLYTPGLFRIGGGFLSEGDPGMVCPPDDGSGDDGSGGDDGTDGGDGTGGGDAEGDGTGGDTGCGADCPVE